MVWGYPHSDLILACFQRRDFYWETAVVHGQDGRNGIGETFHGQ